MLNQRLLEKWNYPPQSDFLCCLLCQQRTVTSFPLKPNSNTQTIPKFKIKHKTSNTQKPLPSSTKKNKNKTDSWSLPDNHKCTIFFHAQKQAMLNNITTKIFILMTCKNCPIHHSNHLKDSSFPALLLNKNPK
jgi:hypothetical protein